MSTNTVELHRVFKSTADRVYRAFVTRDAYAKWLPPHGFIGTVHEMDPQVGGTYRMSFTNFTTGHVYAFGGTYEVLEPGKRVQYTATFDDPAFPGEIRTTVALREVFCGVEIHIRQEGLPAAIPVEGCYLGWQESLELLKNLVEAEIRD